MSGSRILLDTNAIGALLRGSHLIENLLREAEWVGCSVINIIEFKSISLNRTDELLFEQLLSKIIVVDIVFKDNLLIDLVAEIRIKNKLKTPDAIIAASAIVNNATLLTSDNDFKNIKNLTVLYHSEK